MARRISSRPSPLTALVNTAPGYTRPSRSRVHPPEPLEPAAIREPVDLIEDEPRGLLLDPHVPQNSVGQVHVAFTVRPRDVYHVQKQVGGGNLLEGSVEADNQVMRQLLDEPDRVGQQCLVPTWKLDLPGGRVKGREQKVLCQNIRAGERVHERGLAGVRIPDQRHAHHVRSPLALLLPIDLNPLQDFLEHLDPDPDAAAVGLKLCLSRAARADTTAQALEMVPQSPQAGQLVLELRQLDLRACDLCARPPRENIENKLGPVDDLDLHGLLDLPALGGPQIVIEDQDVGVVHLGRSLDPLDHPASNVRLSVQPRAVLNEAVDHHGAGRARELGQLIERLVLVLYPGVGQTHADQDRAFIFRYEFSFDDKPPVCRELGSSQRGSRTTVAAGVQRLEVEVDLDIVRLW